jgi:hypothetical protein
MEMLMFRLVLIGALVFLAGCVGDHGRMGDVNQAAPPHVTPLSPSVTPDQLAHAADEIKTTVQSSTNAAQQSFSGLGAQVAKGAENVDAAVLKFGADVRAVATANLEANLKVTGRIEAVADIVNDLRVDVGLAVNVANRVDLSVKAQADVLADLKIQVAALGAAQVGYKNQLEQTTTSLESGRDTFMQVNGATKEWVEILKNEKNAQIMDTWISAGVVLGVLVIAAIVIGYVLEMSRRRAEARSHELVNLLEEFRK